MKGKLTDMDVHLLHKSADGKMAMLAVRLREDMACAERRAGHALAAPARDRRREPTKSRRW